jgi:hypothetical protein
MCRQEILAVIELSPTQHACDEVLGNDFIANLFLGGLQADSQEITMAETLAAVSDLLPVLIIQQLCRKASK